MNKYIKLFLAVLIIGFIVFYRQEIYATFQSHEVYAVGDLVVDWGVGTGNVGPVFTVNNMAPGDSVQRPVTIRNNSTAIRPLAIKGLKTLPGNLDSGMTFTIKDGSTTVYSKTLANFFADSDNADGIFLQNIPAGTAKQFILVAQLQPSVGNTFQNQTVTFNLIFGLSITVPPACQAVNLTGKFPLYGTAKNDVIQGTNGNDVIFGLGGNDTVIGNGGDDCIVTLGGNDTIVGGAGNDVVLSGEGKDTIVGSDGNDILLGEAGNDTVDGGQGKDTCDGEVKLHCEQ